MILFYDYDDDDFDKNWRWESRPGFILTWLAWLDTPGSGSENDYYLFDTGVSKYIAYNIYLTLGSGSKNIQFNQHYDSVKVFH